MINCFRGPQLTNVLKKSIPATGNCQVLKNLPSGQTAGSGIGLTMAFSYIGNGYFLQARCAAASHVYSGSRALHAGRQGTRRKASAPCWAPLQAR